MSITHTKSEVRLALPAEEAELMEFAKAMHAENGVRPFYEPRVREFIRRMLRQDNGLIGVIRGPDGIEAAIGLTVAIWWYTGPESAHLEDLFCFCLEKYRRSDHAKALLQFAKYASKELSIPLFIGVLSSERTQAKVRLYQRQFGAPAGAVFLVHPDKVAVQG